jgi:hypothetical protein
MIFAIYDLEIAKAIPPRNSTERLPNIQYCEGWDDFDNMGIACWAYCLLNSSTWEISEPVAGTEISSFPENEGERIFADEFVGLNMSIPNLWIGGFNSKKFDDKLLEKHGFREGFSHFDILEEIVDAAGLKNIEYWNLDPKRSYSLAAIAEKNGCRKTLSGELAPIEWQRGNHQLVIDYCKNDVQVEAKMLRLLLQGELIDPNDCNKLVWGI